MTFCLNITVKVIFESNMHLQNGEFSCHADSNSLVFSTFLYFLFIISLYIFLV